MKLIKSKPNYKQWGLPSLIDDFYSDSFLVSPLQGNDWNWTPAIDVLEKENEFAITAEVPGMDEKDLRVEYHNGYLTLSGEKREETKSEDGNAYRLERKFGSFSRCIQLGETIDEDKVQASYKDGVLKVTLPKTEKAKPKRIKIA